MDEIFGPAPPPLPAALVHTDTLGAAAMAAGAQRGSSPPAPVAALSFSGQQQKHFSTPSTSPSPFSSPKSLVLSYSRLHEYLWCPYRYYLSREAKLPSPANAAMLYGRCLHAAVAEAGDMIRQASLRAAERAQQQGQDGQGSSLGGMQGAAHIAIGSSEESMRAAVNLQDLRGSLPVLQQLQEALQLLCWDEASAAAAGISAEAKGRIQDRQRALVSAFLEELPSLTSFRAALQRSYSSTWSTGRDAKLPATAFSGVSSTAGGAAAADAAQEQGKLLKQLQEDEQHWETLSSISDAQAEELRQAAWQGIDSFLAVEVEGLRSKLQGLLARLRGSKGEREGERQAEGASAAGLSKPLHLQLPAFIEEAFSVQLPLHSASTISAAASSSASAPPPTVTLIGIIDRLDAVPLRPTALAAAASAPPSSLAVPSVASKAALLIREFKSSMQWRGPGYIQKRGKDPLQLALYALALEQLRKQLVGSGGAGRRPVAAQELAPSDIWPLLCSSAAASPSSAASADLIGATDEASLEAAVPQLVQLEGIETGEIVTVAVGQQLLQKVTAQVQQAATGIQARAFTATPSLHKCGMCPYSKLCQHSYGLVGVGGGAGGGGEEAGGGGAEQQTSSREGEGGGRQMR